MDDPLLRRTGIRPAQLVDSGLAELNRKFDTSQYNRAWVASQLNVSKNDLHRALQSDGLNPNLAQRAVTLVRTRVNQN